MSLPHRVLDAHKTFTLELSLLLLGSICAFKLNKNNYKNIIKQLESIWQTFDK